MMDCACGGLIVWEWANPPYPAHFRCTNCRRVYTKAEIKKMKVASQLQPEVKTMTTPTGKTKICSVCKKELPATDEYFSRNKASKDGLDYLCKPCKSNRMKALRLSRAEKKNPGHVPEKKAGGRRSRVVVATISGQKYEEGPLTKASPEEIIKALRKGVALEIIGDLKKMTEELEAKWN